MRAALSSVAAVALLVPGWAQAGAGAAAPGAPCNCTTPPVVSIPSAHTVTVPGVNVIPPSVYVAPPRIGGGVGTEGSFDSDIWSSVQASSSSSVSTSVSASASAGAAAYSSPLAVANSQAANLLAASGSVTAGGAVYGEGGISTSIPSLVVATPGYATRQVCARTASVASAVAIQAVCLDDKDVPHPASQVSPGPDVPAAYAGELFRCIAGAHMQYVTAPYAGAARFDHGQTAVCAKGDALWRDAAGRVQCRPQTPARDCNERSLLRRYGAGIKILKAAASQCVEWRTEAVAGDGAVQGSLQLDGGVGG